MISMPCDRGSVEPSGEVPDGNGGLSSTYQPNMVPYRDIVQKCVLRDQPKASNGWALEQRFRWRARQVATLPGLPL